MKECIADIYQKAHLAKDANDGENALRYYKMILEEDPESWEASFFVVYFDVINSNIANIQTAVAMLTDQIAPVLHLVRGTISDSIEQAKAYAEIAERVYPIKEQDKAASHCGN